MSQGFQNAPSTEKMRDSRPKFLERDESLRTAFSGSSAPSDPSDGQWWLDTSGGGNGVLKQRRNGSWQVNDALTALLTSALDTATDLGGGSASNSKVPSQAAVKAYADALIAANDAMVFKGVIDCSGNPNYPAGSRGEVYKVSVAGKIGGASGPNVEVSDQLLCITDGTSGGNHATVGANWAIIQANVDGAMTGPPGGVADGEIVLFDGTSGRTAKGGLTVDTDPQMAADSDARVISQKRIKEHLAARNAKSLIDFISDAAVRASILAGTETNVSSYINAAVTAGVAALICPAGKLVIDATVTLHDIALIGVAPAMDVHYPYGANGTVFVINSRTVNPFYCSQNVIFGNVSFYWPAQYDRPDLSLIDYKPLIQNPNTSTPLTGFKMYSCNVINAYDFFDVGSASEYDKSGALAFIDCRIFALRYYFKLENMPEYLETNGTIFSFGPAFGDECNHYGGGGAAAKSLAVTSFTRSGTTGTINRTAHGLAVGQKVTISGATGGDAALYNKTHIVVTVPNANSVTVTLDSTPSADATGTLLMEAFWLRDYAVQNSRLFYITGDSNGTTLATKSVDGPFCDVFAYGIGIIIECNAGRIGNAALRITADACQQLVKVHSGGVIYASRIEVLPGSTFYKMNYSEKTTAPVVQITNPAQISGTATGSTLIIDGAINFANGSLIECDGDYVEYIEWNASCRAFGRGGDNATSYAGRFNTANAHIVWGARRVRAHAATSGSVIREGVVITAGRLFIAGGAHWDRCGTPLSIPSTTCIARVFGCGSENTGATYSIDIHTPYIGMAANQFDKPNRVVEALGQKVVADAVNGIDVYGAPTGYRPSFRSVGADASVGLDFMTKGTDDFGSSIGLKPGGFAGMTIRAVNNAVNFFYVLPAVTGNGVFFGALGDDANINMVIAPKGTGQFFSSANFLPLNSNTQQLGSTSYMWADAFFGDGAVLNFNNGDVTITHGSNSLTGAGGQLFWTYNGGAGLAPIRSINNTDAAAVCGLFIEGDRATPAANDEVFASFILSDASGNQTEFGRMSTIGTTITDGAENARMDWFLMQAGTLTGKLRLNTAGLCPWTTDGISLGTASLMWSDIFLASGAVVNFNNGDVTLTHSSDLLTIAGGKLRCAAGIVITPPASGVTPANNGDVEFEFTSNTQLTIKAKGGDGTTRSVVLTLA